MSINMWRICSRSETGFELRVAMELLASLLHGINRALRKWAGSWRLSQDSLLCCESAHASFKEKQKCWLWGCSLAMWETGKVTVRQTENLLGEYLLGIAHVKTMKVFGLRAFLGLNFWWWDRWVGWTPCLCSFVRSTNAVVTWPNWMLLA